MKRKNIFPMLAAGAATLVVSCSQITPERGASDTAIRFGTRGITVMSKAFVETTNEALRTDGFQVAAVIDATGATMFNASASYEESKGTYRVDGADYFYPASGTLSFYAVYPASQAITVEEGVATLAYTQDGDTDLVAAVQTEVARMSDPVYLEFQHLLSQVSINCRCKDNVDCRVEKITVKDFPAAVWNYSDFEWIGSGPMQEYTFFSDDEGLLVEGLTPVGSPMSFIPGNVTLTVKWTCCNKDTDIVISSNEQSIDVELTNGIHSTLNLGLTTDAAEFSFDPWVCSWSDFTQERRITPSGKYAVTAEAGEEVLLPEVLFKKDVIIRIDWGDGSSDVFTNPMVEPKSVIPAHTYTRAFDGEARLYIDHGSREEVLWAVDQYDENVTSLRGNELLVPPGEMESMIMVDGCYIKFAPGNLYWDGSGFRFEEHQYDFSRTWNPDHVSHFYVTTSEQDISEAYARDPVIHDSYDGDFFAAYGGAVDGYTVLSEDLWASVISNNFVGYASIGFTTQCAILAPNGVNVTLKSNYSPGEWAFEEKANALVALPLSGFRDGSNMTLGMGGSKMGCYHMNMVPRFYEDNGLHWEYSDELFEYYGSHSTEGKAVSSTKSAYAIRLVQLF